MERSRKGALLGDGAESLSRRRSRWCALIAAVVYLGFAAWLLRAVLADPTRLVAFPVRIDDRPEAPIGVLDQVMVITVAVRNARVLVSRPWELFAGQLCYPMPHAHTLGEHMLGLGVLAAPGYALTGDPLASYNSALLWTLWIPAMAMYALALRFTASPPAAFVSGLLFGFLPVRIGDVGHPYTHGDLWTPLVLLFFHRLIARGRWRDAFGLAAFLGLQLLESFYSVLECAVVAIPFAAWATWRHRAELPARAPKLAVAAAIVLGVVWLVLSPYLDTRATWSLLASRGGWLNFPGAFFFGGLLYPGSVACALAVVALVDRGVRGPRSAIATDDPRWAMAVAGLAALWTSLIPLEVPGLGVKLPAPLLLARGIVPGVDAIRVPGLIGYGFPLACAFLASFGVLALGRWRPGRGALVVGIVAAVAALAERTYRPLAAATFRRTTEIEAVAMRPDEQVIDLVRSLRGPIVDVPTPLGRKLGTIRGVTEHLLLAAYHGQPTSSCYNSFRGPVTAQVWDLVERLPDPRAGRALAALGFENALVLERFLKPARREELARAGAAEAPAPGSSLRSFARRASAGEVVAYALSPGAPAVSDWSLLSARAEDAAAVPTVPSGSGAKIPLVIENRGAATFRHPEPIAPTPVVVRWRPLEGTPGRVHEVASRVLLPLALASEDALAITVPVETPAEPGEYEVALARVAAPTAELARRRVRVVSAAEPDSH